MKCERASASWNSSSVTLVLFLRKEAKVRRSKHPLKCASGDRCVFARVPRPFPLPPPSICDCSNAHKHDTLHYSGWSLNEADGLTATRVASRAGRSLPRARRGTRNQKMGQHKARVKRIETKKLQRGTYLCRPTGCT